MAGLNDFLTGTTTKETTLPSWYDSKQQALASDAVAQAKKTPTFADTVAGTAIANLGDTKETNPFLQAQSQLGAIGSSASANPWLVSNTGQVTPNKNTVLGAQFAAQEQQLNKILPSLTAQPQAAAVGTGNFGSLRGQTAVDVAKASALADMQQKQMQAYQQAQQTGVQAASGLSNVGAQGTSTMTTLGQAQQAAPLTATANLAQILSSLKAPASVTSSEQLSPLQMIGSLGSAVQAGLSGTDNILGTLFPGSGTKGQAGYVAPLSVAGLLSNLAKNAKDWWSSNPTTNTTDGTNVADDPTGAQTVVDNTNADNNPANYEIDVPQ